MREKRWVLRGQKFARKSYIAWLMVAVICAPILWLLMIISIVGVAVETAWEEARDQEWMLPFSNISPQKYREAKQSDNMTKFWNLWRKQP